MATNPYTQGLADLAGVGAGSRKGLDAIYKAMQASLGQFGSRLDYLDRSTDKAVGYNGRQLAKRLGNDRERGIADVIQTALASGGSVDDAQRRDLEQIATQTLGAYQGYAKAHSASEKEYGAALRGLDKQYAKDLKASAVKEKLARQAELEQNLLGQSAGLQAQSGLYDAQMSQLGLNQAALAGGGGSYTVGGVGGLSAAEAYIIQRESGGNPNARNPSSGAFGIWQGNPKSGTLQSYARQFGFDPYTRDVQQQLMMFRAYVADRYGSAENAARFWKQNGWY
jgi:hypothetical protein